MSETLEEIEYKIAEAEYRLCATTKCSKCARDTKKYLNRLYEKRAKLRKKGGEK